LGRNVHEDFDDAKPFQTCKPKKRLLRLLRPRLLRPGLSSPQSPGCYHAFSIPTPSPTPSRLQAIDIADSSLPNRLDFVQNPVAAGCQAASLVFFPNPGTGKEYLPPNTYRQSRHTYEPCGLLSKLLLLDCLHRLECVEVSKIYKSTTLESR